MGLGNESLQQYVLWHSRSLPVLSSLLKMEDLGVRTGAGEAIALLYEMTNTSISIDSDDEVDSYNEVLTPTAKTTNSKVVYLLRPTEPHRRVLTLFGETEIKDLK